MWVYGLSRRTMVNHELETGDELVDNGREETLTVEVHSDGGVSLDGEGFTEAEICAALRDGVLTRTDGKDSELVKHY